MIDSLGDRMKSYERISDFRFPIRSWTVVRLDGKSFHTYTRGLRRPYDEQLMQDMAGVARYLAEEVSGCRIAYTQSDEITLVLDDLGSENTQAWFGGKLQKIVSVTASMASAMLNQLRPGLKLAVFDSRVFTVPDIEEAANCLVWRQQDATRNSISMAAQALFSHRELQGKSSSEMQEMMWQHHSVNWNDEDPRFKRGQIIYRIATEEDVTFTHKRTGEVQTVEGVVRHAWASSAAPKFTAERSWLMQTLAGQVQPLPVG